MGYSFVRTYQLKQQTPLIHFQHDQVGATLRATEVKPKLDRYIAERYKEEKGEVIPSSWRMGETDALNCRISLLCANKRIIPLQGKEYNIFYGNTGRDVPIQGVMTDEIEMKIVCVVTELREYIDRCIRQFFLTHNFGTMQRKGFGSFICGNDDHRTICESLCRCYGAQYCYSFDGGTDPFQRIKIVYSIMKSGLNFHGYRRSLLFMYMHKVYRMGNEKSWLKQNDMAPNDVGPNASKAMAYEHQNRSHKHYYVRALLGTGDHIDFLNNLVDRRDRTTVSISCISKTIERYRSPVFFKVIQTGIDHGKPRYKVYYIGQSDSSGQSKKPLVCDEEFAFDSPYHGRKIDKLTVPSVEGSFVEGFLAFCYEELNKSQSTLNQDYPGSGYTALTGFIPGICIQQTKGGDKL